MYQRNESSDDTLRIIREMKSLERKYPVLCEYLQATTARTNWAEQVLHMAQQWAALSLGLSSAPRIADIQVRFGGAPAHLGGAGAPVLGGDGIPILRTPVAPLADYGVAESMARGGVSPRAPDRQEHMAADTDAPMGREDQAQPMGRGDSDDESDFTPLAPSNPNPVGAQSKDGSSASSASGDTQGKGKRPPSLEHLIG
jgi:hypothetical protein